uniref:Uncharacterized protein n=1 Tax=Oryza barthii TaxID=65489 RepID=A0A0D3G1V8_9ORYZ
MEAKRRCDEKIDRILKKLDEIDANRNKFFEEMGASIKATTAVLTATSHSPLQAPPSSTPTTCSMKCSNDDHPWATSSSGHIDKETAPTIALDLGDGEDKVHDPCIVTKDSSKVTLTTCSMKCSSPDTEPDLTMVAEVTYASAATASMELVTAQKAIGATYSDTSDHTKVMHAKCLTVVLDAIGDTGQAMVVFQTWTDAFKDDPTSVQFMDFFSSSMMANIKWNIPMPTKCLVQCLGHGNMALMPTNPLDVNPWPPPWLDGVIKGRDLRPSLWPGFNFCGTVEHLVPPWPPPTQISYLALLLTDFAILSTEMLLTVRHWARVHLMLPWPPPNNSDSKHTMIQLEHCWSWEIGVTINQSAWKEQWDLVNQRSCIFSEIYGMHELGISYHNLLQVKLFKPKIDKQIRVVLSNAKLLENYIKEIYESQCGDSTIPFFVQLTWDPGGSGNNLHRLEDKPNVKERGLLATQLCCIWARLAMFQSKPRQAQLATYISSNSKHLGDLGTEERQQRRLASVARQAAAAATWRPVGSLSIYFPTSSPSSSPPP